MADRTEVVVAGHICLDIIPAFHQVETALSRLLTPGRLTEIGKATICTGGAVANVGLALHRLGVHTRLMGKIGDDLWGRAILGVLGSAGASLPEGMIVDPSENSSYTLVISPPGCDRIFLHDPGANNTFSARDVPVERLTGARLFHFGYPPLMARMFADDGQELVALFQKVKKAGLITSLDMAMPDPGASAGRADWRAILAAVLPYVDLFLPSVDETLQMLYPGKALSGGAGEWDAAAVCALADELLGMGARIVGLKAGSHGLYLRTAGGGASWADRELWMPCFQVDVVGTTGAGDATVAGFLLGYLAGLGPEAVMQTAVAVGASCVEAADAASGIPNRARLAARLEQGWRQQPVGLPLSGWRAGACGAWRSPRDAHNII